MLCILYHHHANISVTPPIYLLIGYSQLDATLNCYLRPDRFDALPLEPTLHKQGSEAFLVSLVEGVLKDIPGMDTIRSLSSFRYVLPLYYHYSQHYTVLCAILYTILHSAVYTVLYCALFYI